MFVKSMDCFSSKPASEENGCLRFSCLDAEHDFSCGSLSVHLAFRSFFREHDADGVVSQHCKAWKVMSFTCRGSSI